MRDNKWIYETNKNNSVRYVLGTKGKKTLLCFGINPSTASPEKLDNTLKSVERLAINNGFDSWIMMNIYPQRATNPDDIHKKIDQEITANNLLHISKIINSQNTVLWAAWGTLIDKRPFLHDCLKDIVLLTKKLDTKWICIGPISKKGHPHHPLYLKSTEATQGFNMETYINNL